MKLIQRERNKEEKMFRRAKSYLHSPGGKHFKTNVISFLSKREYPIYKALFFQQQFFSTQRFVVSKRNHIKKKEQKLSYLNILQTMPLPAIFNEMRVSGGGKSSGSNPIPWVLLIPDTKPPILDVTSNT